MLREYRTEQMKEALRLGSAWIGKRKPAEYDENYIFIQWNGKQMHPDTPYSTFQKILKRYNAAFVFCQALFPKFSVKIPCFQQGIFPVFSGTQVVCLDA